MIHQLAVEDEVLVMPLDSTECEAGLGCSGLGCTGLGEIDTGSMPGDKTLKKLAKIAKKQAKKAARGETPPIIQTIPSLPDFTLPRVGSPALPGPPIDSVPPEVVTWIPAPQGPVLTLPPKSIGGSISSPAPVATVTDTFWIPTPQDPVLTLPSRPADPMPVTVTGGSYQPPSDDRLPGMVRRDWRQVLSAPRSRVRRRSDADGSTGIAVESPPFQVPPTVSVGPPAGDGSVAVPVGGATPTPQETPVDEPGVVNIGGMQIRTSTLMWGGAIVGGFILLNNMMGKKR